MAETPGPRELKKLCVFCGASSGNRAEYMAAAKALGECLVEHKIGLVYGGGTVGLMGEIARTVAAGLGEEGVFGVIPQALTPKEVSGVFIGNTVTVPDMHVRKAMMAQHADGFIAMPGGFGTLEELMEVVTWQQLGFHAKPIALYNAGGFFDPLLAFFEHAVREGFVKQQHYHLVVSSDPQELLDKMRAFTPPVSLVASIMGSTASVGVDVSISSADAERKQ